MQVFRYNVTESSCWGLIQLCARLSQPLGRCNRYSNVFFTRVWADERCKQSVSTREIDGFIFDEARTGTTEPPSLRFWQALGTAYLQLPGPFLPGSAGVLFSLTSCAAL